MVLGQVIRGDATGIEEYTQVDFGVDRLLADAYGSCGMVLVTIIDENLNFQYDAALTLEDAILAYDPFKYRFDTGPKYSHLE